MTKAQELAALDKFIALLGPSTYLGSYLADNRGTIERDINSDFTPQLLSIHKTVEYNRGLLDAAKADAEGIRKSAQAFAAEERRKAHDEITAMRARLVRDLESAQATLAGWR